MGNVSKGLGQAMLGCLGMIMIVALIVVFVTGAVTYVSDSFANSAHYWAIVGEQREQTERLRIVVDGAVSINWWDDITDWSVTLPAVIISGIVLIPLCFKMNR